MVEIVSDIVQLFDETGMEVAYGTRGQMKNRLREFPGISEIEVYVGETQKFMSADEFLKGI